MTKKRKREKTSAHVVPQRPGGLSPEEIKRLCTTRLFQAPVKVWRIETNRAGGQEANRSYTPNSPFPPSVTTEDERPLRETDGAADISANRNVVKSNIIEPATKNPSIHSINGKPGGIARTVQVSRSEPSTRVKYGSNNGPAQRLTSIPTTSSHWSSSDARQSLNAFLQQNDGSDSESSDDESSSNGKKEVPRSRHIAGSIAESFAEELRRATKDLGPDPRLPSNSPTDSIEAGDRVHPQSIPAEQEETHTDSKLGSPAPSESEGVSLPQALRSDRRKSMYSQDQDQTTSIIKSLAPSKTDPEGSGRRNVTTLAIRSSNQASISSKNHQQESTTAAPIPSGSQRIHQPNNIADTITTPNTLARPTTPNQAPASPHVAAAPSSQDDVYAIVNQIARDVLGSPRAFPGSKLLNSLDQSFGNGTEHLGISDVGIDESGHGRTRSQTALTLLDLCNQPSGVAPRPATWDTRSDSSLSELSRISTPPCLDNAQQSAAGRNEQHAVMLEESKVTVGKSALPLSRKKKCRMTGITSKHFSPVKSKNSKQAKSRPQDALSGGMPSDVNEEQSTVDSVSHPPDILEALEVQVSEQVPECQASHGTVNDFPDPIEFRSPPKAPKKRSPTKRPKTTGKYSAHFPHPNNLDFTLLDRVDLYNTTASSRKVPTGTSICPVPSIHEPHFGIVQEKLWREPFWLLVAVVFLNQTTGRAAVPTFWNLKRKWPTIEALATADQQEVMAFIQHLGLQNQRSKRIIGLAQVWLRDPPVAGRRHRTLHYPAKGDGAGYKPGQVIEGAKSPGSELPDAAVAAPTPPPVDDTTLTPGALEIGHLPGCKQYAYDSWRIFCRDVLRGVADDYNGLNARSTTITTTTTPTNITADAVNMAAAEAAATLESLPRFEPEWQRVLPQDKELRACVRWMWLREGWIWDPLTGEKRMATLVEMEKAREGEMEIGDPGERKFAVAAAAEATGSGMGSVGGVIEGVSSTAAVIVGDDNEMVG